MPEFKIIKALRKFSKSVWGNFNKLQKLFSFKLLGNADIDENEIRNLTKAHIKNIRYGIGIASVLCKQQKMNNDIIERLVESEKLLKSVEDDL